MKTTAKIMAVLLLLALVGSVSARVITVEVTGVVDYFSTGGELAMDGSVGVGSIMSGYCTYATDTLDEYPANEDVGVYPVISILMTIGNYAFTHDPTSTDSPYFKVGTVDPAYSAMTQSGRFDGTVTINGSGPLTYDEITWNWTYMSVFHLRTSSSEYIPTDALPDLDSWPDLSVFDMVRGFETRFDGEGDDYFHLYGEITSLTVIPEPAKTYYVDAAEGSDNNDGLSPQTAFATIQKAIDSAFDGDTVIVADGTYTGPGNRDIDFLGKAITVRSENGPENCIIDCNGTKTEPNRGFDFHNGEDANSLLNGFTIFGGHADGWPSSERSGGGIHCTGSSPTITNCTISGNSAKYEGGGIYCEWFSSPTITNCTISDNSGKYGGGISCEWKSNPTITNCTISDNIGSGICCRYSSPAINNCIISGNTANGFGGAISLWDGSNPTITNCTITGNNAAYEGGAISCLDGPFGSSSPVITNCTITDNSSNEKGGGIFCRYSSPIITNCRISGNTVKGMGLARSGGGGIYCEGYWGFSSNLIINNCIITGNSSDDAGGGIVCKDKSLMTISNCTISSNLAKYAGGGIFCGMESNPTITNCIFLGNEAPEGSQIYLEGNVNAWVRYTDVQSDQNDIYVDYDCNLNWGPGNIDADPCFVEPGFWDANDTLDDVNDDFWIEGDYYLLPDSLCIDAGDPNYIPEPGETDIDGNPRVIDGRIDMGAYETNYIQAAMKLTPQMLNCNSKGKYIKAHITLPEGFLPQDVDVNAPAVAEPMGAYSEYIKVIGNNDGPVRLEICFDREAFCDGLIETGEVEITVIGSLTTSRYFYTNDTIKIKPRR